MKRFHWYIMILVLAGCSSTARMSDPPQVSERYRALDPGKPIALVNAVIIDGTGADPIRGGTIVFDGGKIAAVGKEVPLPEGCQILDMEGATVLPGLVNAHVHNAYYERHAAIFAYSGVTTVRDLSYGAGDVWTATAFRDRALADPKKCRIVSAGTLITVPWGYMALGGLTVGSEEEARQKVDMELDAGVDFVKIVFQEPVFPQLANLSPMLGSFIVARAHARGVPVTAHVGTARDLAMALDCGVDDIAHVVYDELTDDLIARMVSAHIPMEPTLTDWATSTGREREIILSNFKRFMDAGGIIALGAEHVHTAKNAGAFVGMPLPELKMMREGGMDPMRIIVASTKTAADVCGLGSTLGTLEAGKLADILVLDGDPLTDLDAFSRVRIVVHSGVIIRG
jgi:imidazolonepropionase-like amidohydrolase